MQLFFSNTTAPKGFTNSSVTNSNAKEYQKIIRELCQNSYDAIIEAIGGGN